MRDKNAMMFDVYSNHAASLFLELNSIGPLMYGRFILQLYFLLKVQTRNKIVIC